MVCTRHGRGALHRNSPGLKERLAPGSAPAHPLFPKFGCSCCRIFGNSRRPTDNPACAGYRLNNHAIEFSCPLACCATPVTSLIQMLAQADASAAACPQRMADGAGYRLRQPVPASSEKRQPRHFAEHTRLRLLLWCSIAIQSRQSAFAAFAQHPARQRRPFAVRRYRHGCASGSRRRAGSTVADQSVARGTQSGGAGRCLALLFIRNMMPSGWRRSTRTHCTAGANPDGDDDHAPVLSTLALRCLDSTPVQQPDRRRRARKRRSACDSIHRRKARECWMSCRASRTN